MGSRLDGPKQGRGIKMTAAEIIARWKGKSYGGDTETVFVLNSHDLAAGFARCWSNRGPDICAILERAGSVIEAWEDGVGAGKPQVQDHGPGPGGCGVWMKIPVAVLRSAGMLVRPVDSESVPMTAEQKLKIKGEARPPVDKVPEFEAKMGQEAWLWGGASHGADASGGGPGQGGDDGEGGW